MKNNRNPITQYWIYDISDYVWCTWSQYCITADMDKAIAYYMDKAAEVAVYGQFYFTNICSSPK